MPNYVTDSLKRLGHVPPTSPQYSPHAHIPIKYGQTGQQQYAAEEDHSTLLSPKETQHVQSTTGSFLYYGRAIDYTILPALNDIASMQAHPTERTKQKAKRLMDYLHTSAVPTTSAPGTCCVAALLDSQPRHTQEPSAPRRRPRRGLRVQARRAARRRPTRDARRGVGE